MKTLLSIILLTIIASSVAAQTTATSAESRINTTTANRQQNPATAMDADGNYIVVWEALSQDGDGYGVYGQLYAVGGTATGSEFLVNTTTNNDQRFPDVAMDDNGNFVVVWQSYNQDGNGWGIYAQRFNSSATAQGNETLINGTTAGQQRLPKVASDGAGNFAVTWDNAGDIYCRTYDNVGNALTSETLVNTTTANWQSYPDIAMDNNGDFVIVWQSLNQDGDDYGIYAQRYTSSAAANGSEFAVNSTTTNSQLQPVIAMDDKSNFVIAWTSNIQDGSQEGVYFQAYNNTGMAQGSEILVNTTTAGAQNNPAIGFSNLSSVVIAWNSYGQDGANYGVYQQAYDYDGSAAPLANGVETLVNTTTASFQQAPAVAMRTTGDVAIVWQSGVRLSTSGQDGDDYGVYQKLYTVSSTLPIELLSFEVTAQADRTTLLEWGTATELNNRGFHVQRFDGTTWVTLGFVESAGSTLAAQWYRFVDPAPKSDWNYYRLEQEDIDGKRTYSPVEAVFFEENLRLSIYPNPTVDQLNIRRESTQGLLQPMSWQLFGANGQLLQQQMATTDALITLDLRDLLPGSYVIKLEQNGVWTSHVIIKQ